MTQGLTHTHTHTHTHTLIHTHRHCKHDLIACYVPDAIIVAGYKVIKQNKTKQKTAPHFHETHSLEIFNGTATIHNTV